MGKLKNRIALITSSTRGIGLVSAEKLGAQGAIVYLAARSAEAAEKIIKKMVDQGCCARFVYFNAQEIETYTTMVDQVIEKEGRLDILVNNYGATDVKLDKDLLQGDSEAFFKIIQRNLQSVYLSCKAAIPHMMKNGGGAIVNISSIGSILPDVSRIAYGVSKAAVNSLTQNIAVQYARHHIRCNAILPGLIATDAALTHMTDAFRASYLKHVPLNRIGKPEDIANAVLFYVSDDSSYITGALQEVGGGFAIPTPQYGDYQS